MNPIPPAPLPDAGREKAAAVATAAGAAAAPPSLVAKGFGGSGAVEVSPNQLVATCLDARDRLGGRLATMVGWDDRAASGAFRLAYVFAVGDGWWSVETVLDPARPVFPSVTPHLPAAHWYEREVRDLLGLEPDGHPDHRRLVLHENWPDGVYPLRKDFDPRTPVPMVEAPPPRFHSLHGDGIVEIPVGPIHAGVIEPGHFRFAAVGELVLHLEARLFYTHRGLEKLVEGRLAGDVLPIVERICGVCGVSHQVSFCQAVEAIAEVEVPPRARAIRTVALELERLYNHVGDLGNLAAGAGFAVAAMQGARLKDELQRLAEQITGSRFLRGLGRVGGVARDLDPEARRLLAATLGRFGSEYNRLADLLFTTESFVERMTTTGVLDRATAATFGAVGVAARASGLERDARHDHPHAWYGEIAPPPVGGSGGALPIAVRQTGDVHARALVRHDEIRASLRLIRHLLDHLPGGPYQVAVPERLPPSRTALGVTESPRGENLHWLRSAADGTIDRYRVRSASYPNWPCVALAVPGNMVPDFPLINKSFELCYSCLDR